MVHSTRLESVRRKARGFESHLLRLRLAEVPITSGRKRASLRHYVMTSSFARSARLRRDKIRFQIDVALCEVVFYFAVVLTKASLPRRNFSEVGYNYSDVLCISLEV